MSQPADTRFPFRHEGDWTVDEILALPEDRDSGQRVELVDAEIESPSARVQDRTLKRALYAEAGVAYYLLVDPKRGPAEATLLELADGDYVPIAKSEGGLLRMDRPFAAEVRLA